MDLCSRSQIAGRPRHTKTAGRFISSLERDMQISRTIESRPQGTWPVVKAGLVLVAIVLLALTVAAIEVRLGITPPDDSATAWVLSGE